MFCIHWNPGWWRHEGSYNSISMWMCWELLLLRHWICCSYDVLCCWISVTGAHVTYAAAYVEGTGLFVSLMHTVAHVTGDMSNCHSCSCSCHDRYCAAPVTAWCCSCHSCRFSCHGCCSCHLCCCYNATLRYHLCHRCCSARITHLYMLLLFMSFFVVAHVNCAALIILVMLMFMSLYGVARSYPVSCRSCNWCCFCSHNMVLRR